MKKLGKRSSLESGTFFAYACKHVVEERLKEYCTLREYGCKFED